MTPRERFEALVSPEPMSGCWLWAGAISDSGYGRFNLNHKNRRAHKVAWELFVGPIAPGLSVCHRCDNKACVNPRHLFLGTQFDNMRDCAIKGHLRAKLTPAQVVEIRGLLSTTRRGEIAARYGVSQSAIYLIAKRENWARVGAA